MDFLPILGQAEWPAWRGGAQQGVSATPAPTHWSATNGFKWTVEIPGKGYASPIVVEDRVYVTSAATSPDSRSLAATAWRAHIRLALTWLVAWGVFLHLWQSASNPSSFPGLAEEWVRRLMLIGLAGALGAYVLLTHPMFEDRWWVRGIQLDLERRQPLLFAGIGALLVGFVAGKTRSAQWTGCAILLAVGVYMLLAPLGYDPRAASLRPDYMKPTYTAFITRGFGACVVLAGVAMAGVVIYRSRSLTQRRSAPALESLTGVVWSRRQLLEMVGIVLLAVAAYSALLWFGTIRHDDESRGRVESFLVQNVASAPGRGYIVCLLFGGLVLVGTVWLASRGRLTSPPRGRGPLGVLQGVALGLVVLEVVDAGSVPTDFPMQRMVFAVDRATGRLDRFWQGLAGPWEAPSAANSPATPTPAYWSNRIYCSFGSAGIVCLDRSGQVVWANTNVLMHNKYGASSSPVIGVDVVVIPCEGVRDARVAALDLETGRERWSAGRLDCTNWNGVTRTPVLLPAHQPDSVLLWGWRDITVCDLATGAPRLKLPYDAVDSRGVPDYVTSVASDGERVFLMEQGQAHALDVKALTSGDTNAVLWSRRIRGANVTTPVAARGLVFQVGTDGTAVCVEASTGEVRWKQHLPGQYYSSPVVAGDVVYFTNEAGRTTAFRCAPKLSVVATNQIGERVFATPAVADGHLYLRTEKRLYCLAATP